MGLQKVAGGGGGYGLDSELGPTKLEVTEDSHYSAHHLTNHVSKIKLGRVFGKEEPEN